MHIYRADLRDLAVCLTLDGSYETDHVWQVIQQSGGRRGNDALPDGAIAPHDAGANIRGGAKRCWRISSAAT